MSMKRLVVVALAVIGLATPAVVYGQSPPQEASGSADSEASGEQEGASAASDGLWRPEFRDIQPWEYVATAGAYAVAIDMRFFVARGPPPLTEGPWLFDQPVMDLLASPTVEGRRRWETLGDITWIGAMVFRAFDATVMPGVVHGDWATAHRMVMMDLEGFALMSAVAATVQPIVGRTRPIALGCGKPTMNKAYCGVEENRSFISGHVATATTGAALTCTHHLNMPLLGPRWAGATLCGVSSALAFLNGIARVGNQSHYPTDVVLGWGIGLVSGWVVPQSLHYGWGGRRTSDLAAEDQPNWRLSLVPGGPSGNGLGLQLQF